MSQLWSRVQGSLVRAEINGSDRNNKNQKHPSIPHVPDAPNKTQSKPLNQIQIETWRRTWGESKKQKLKPKNQQKEVHQSYNFVEYEERKSASETRTRLWFCLLDLSLSGTTISCDYSFHHRGLMHVSPNHQRSMFPNTFLVLRLLDYFLGLLFAERCLFRGNAFNTRTQPELQHNRVLQENVKSINAKHSPGVKEGRNFVQTLNRLNNKCPIL